MYIPGKAAARTAAFMCAAAFVAAGCANAPPAAPSPAPVPVKITAAYAAAGKMPPSVQAALKQRSAAVLVGVGTEERLRYESDTRAAAVIRARADISRQLGSVVTDMVLDYQSGSEMSSRQAESLLENVTLALSHATLRGSYIDVEAWDESGGCWIVVVMRKPDAIREIKQVVNSAKSGDASLAAFGAQEDLDKAFEKESNAQTGAGIR